MLFSNAFTLSAATVTPATTQAGGGGNDEVQTLTIANATDGSFTVTFDGQTTAAIDYPPTEAAVTAALEALSNIGSGDVDVSIAGDVITVTFRGALEDTDVAQFTTTVTALSNAVQINDETTDPTEFHVHTTDVMYLGNSADTCEYLIPQDYPQEVEFSLSETVYARGTGTIYTLATGLSKTPAR